MRQMNSAQNVSSRVLNKKSKCMPERGAKLARQIGDCDEYRRKTRLQVLREKQLRAVNTSLEFSEVSIQTLHSICAPTASQHQAKKSHLHSANISASQKLLQQQELRRSPLGLLSSSRQNILCTSETCSLQESRLKAMYHNRDADEVNNPLRSPNDAVDGIWLEVSVEIAEGIDLVVDLNLDRHTDWLTLERNSCMLVPPDIAADDLRGTDPQANDLADVACLESRYSAEGPSIDTLAEDSDQITTTCTAMDGDAGSKLSQMAIMAACVPVDSQESSTSGVKGLRNEGFTFASLEQMPTFLAMGIKGSFENESKVNGTSDWAVVCVEA